jgi:HEAT repeat protein
LSAAGLQQILTQDPSATVGKLPGPLSRLLKQDARLFLQALDTLHPLLQGMNSADLPGLRFDLGEANRPVTLEFQGQGSYGIVYRLTVQDQVYALKVYHPDKANELHGPFAETATALYFSNQQLKNLARFYCAHPQTGWALYEFIAPEMAASTRTGKLLESFDVVRLDDSHPNSHNGIRLDYGGLHPKKDSEPPPALPAEAFPVILQQLTAPHRGARRRAASMISHLPDEEAVKAFQIAFAAGDPDSQIRLLEKLHSLPESERLGLFQQGLDSPHPDVQAAAAEQLPKLPYEAIDGAFRQAMQKSLPVQIQAARAILWLPFDVKLEGLTLAMQTGQPAVQLAAVSHLSMLPPDAIEPAIQAAVSAADKAVQAKGVAHAYLLPEAQRDALIRQAMDSQHPALITSVMTQLHHLPPDQLLQMFRTGLATGHPGVQKAAISQIPLVPPELRLALFREALNSPFPNVPALVLPHLKELFLFEKRQVLPLALAALVPPHSVTGLKNLRLLYDRGDTRPDAMSDPDMIKTPLLPSRRW